MNEVNSERSETNDYHKRKDIAKKQREIYIFNGIKKAKHMLSTETINKYIERFPYEKAERTAKGLLKQIGIKVASRQYQMCLEDVDIAYLYTIYRCAYCGYEHIECYFKRMMRIASI